MIKSLFLRLLTSPFAVIIFIRNKLFDVGLLSQNSFEVPVVVVGNLSVGGTGKTPMIEWLLMNLSGTHKLAVLSRGYKRKTKGFLKVELNSEVYDVGDEPLQIKTNYPNIEVAVCENRVNGIHKLLKQNNKYDYILLDDAYQHRYVKPDVCILLTDRNKLFYKDYLIPVGRLREPRSSAKRADMVVVTKCNIDKNNDEISGNIHKHTKANVYFSSIEYGDLILVSNLAKASMPSQKTEVFCISGIANPKSLLKYLNTKFEKVHHLGFRDHFEYKLIHIAKITEYFNNIASQDKIIITTQKDWMRLKSILDQNLLKTIPIYVQPVKHYFNDSDKKEIIEFIKGHAR